MQIMIPVMWMCGVDFYTYYGSKSHSNLKKQINLCIIFPIKIILNYGKWKIKGKEYWVKCQLRHVSYYYFYFLSGCWKVVGK